MTRLPWLMCLLCLPTALGAQERRVVVTGRTEAGLSTVVSDGSAERVISFATSKLRLVQLWGTPPSGSVPGPGTQPAAAMDAFLPPAGESRFVIVELPTAAEDAETMADAASAEAFQREYAAKLPDLAAAHIDPQNPPMHRTSTIDYVVVLRGEVELQLEHGERVRLAAGDVVIQNGTAHAWHNAGKERALLAVVLLGVQPSP